MAKAKHLPSTSELISLERDDREEALLGLRRKARGAARKLASLGGTMPELQPIPRRRQGLNQLVAQITSENRYTEDLDEPAEALGPQLTRAANRYRQLPRKGGPADLDEMFDELEQMGALEQLREKYRPGGIDDWPGSLLEHRQQLLWQIDWTIGQLAAAKALIMSASTEMAPMIEYESEKEARLFEGRRTLFERLRRQPAVNASHMPKQERAAQPGFRIPGDFEESMESMRKVTKRHKTALRELGK